MNLTEKHENIKKISLKSASVLDDKQLKQIYGGSGATTYVKCQDLSNDKCLGKCSNLIDDLPTDGECKPYSLPFKGDVCICEIIKD